ncbi:retinol dehydrogenase 13 [Syngnathoides biaculeatus]|uniref:retinol dehydrogenase 13 n=1 Tax=Syngnathoides biaculeatus TaxID=300417 RepID=UPI002ADE1DF9|nr:retinol dehydrogenase 13 [Syngnathoides biaculeatus]XP_061670487.1 retinol dehydrogenase 13 [Syngnathoides biaculeatus]XP_061670488.1 retinol dehydrogenase 13 [Syngnathoides biaculeatus]XP_061670489.1 retinol dehydrogenase 13 [Syngnathoides biaculeatus]
MEHYVKIARELLKKHAVGITVALAAGATLLALRRWLAAGVCRSKARLDGKTVLITGANTGIGKETALNLAQRGARVILACRDLTKASVAADYIRRKSGNSNVVVMKLDLASLESVRELANKVRIGEERLNILINNAGIMMCPKWKTDDDFEMQFGVNHLGHFLLTNLLLDLLKKSAPSRIVIVSSVAHEKGCINFNDIHFNDNYKPDVSYCQSKLANVLFCRELAVRLKGTGVNTYCVHPGVVRTELGRHLLPTSLWKNLLLMPFLMMLKSPQEGAQTSIFCAVDESLAKSSGLYYSDCAVKSPAPAAMDDGVAKRLWTLSANLVKLE